MLTNGMKKVEYVFNQGDMSEILIELKDAEQETRMLLVQLEDGDTKDEVMGILNRIQFSIHKLEE